MMRTSKTRAHRVVYKTHDQSLPSSGKSNHTGIVCVRLKGTSCVRSSCLWQKLTTRKERRSKGGLEGLKLRSKRIKMLIFTIFRCSQQCSGAFNIVQMLSPAIWCFQQCSLVFRSHHAPISPSKIGPTQSVPSTSLFSCWLSVSSVCSEHFPLLCGGFPSLSSNFFHCFSLQRLKFSTCDLKKVFVGEMIQKHMSTKDGQRRSVNM